MEKKGKINNDENCQPSPKIKAICLLNVKKGKLNDVIQVLESIPEVTKISSVTGDADIIAQIDVDHTSEFHDIYASVIDQIPGVLQTKSYVIMKEFRLR